MRDRHTHPFHWRTATTGNDFNILQTPPDRAMALQQPTLRRYRGALAPRKTRSSPITKSRAVKKRSSQKPAPSKHLHSFVRFQPLSLNSPSPLRRHTSVNTPFPSSIHSPNSLQSFASGYGSSVFPALASCLSSVAAITSLSPNHLP